MDRIEFLQEMIALYDRVLADPGNEDMHPVLRAELEHRRREAEVELHGARGAMGLNPLTGSSN